MPSPLAWLLFECPQLFRLRRDLLADGRAALDAGAAAVRPVADALPVSRLHLSAASQRQKGWRFPVLNVIFGFLFNLMNAANGYAVSHAGHLADAAGLTSPWFVAGLVIAVTGWIINFQADNILIDLRSDGSTATRSRIWRLLPLASRRQLLRRNPASGAALMSLSWAGLVFVLFTLANPVPRAIISHRWYRVRSSDYPAQRKAIRSYSDGILPASYVDAVAHVAVRPGVHRAQRPRIAGDRQPLRRPFW